MMKLLMEETGQGMAEYALILVLVALIVITGLSFMGDTIRNFFQSASNEIEAVM